MRKRNCSEMNKNSNKEVDRHYKKIKSIENKNEAA